MDDEQVCKRCAQITFDPESCTRCGDPLCSSCFERFKVCLSHADTDPAGLVEDRSFDLDSDDD